MIKRETRRSGLMSSLKWRRIRISIRLDRHSSLLKTRSRLNNIWIMAIIIIANYKVSLVIIIILSLVRIQGLERQSNLNSNRQRFLNSLEKKLM